MIAMRTADVTARVVAWHNRHPLARRIVPDDVSGIGVVVLPFALKPPPADDDGEPAAAAELTPIFGDDWMFHAAQRRLGDWVRRHGVYPLAGCSHWPLRQIDADIAQAHGADGQGLTGRTARHVITAVVDSGGQRVRVLLAPGTPLRSASVFGQRLFSLPRMSSLAGAGASMGLALGVAAWWGTGPPAPHTEVEGVATASPAVQVAELVQPSPAASSAAMPATEPPVVPASAPPMPVALPASVPTVPSASSVPSVPIGPLPAVAASPAPPFDTDPVERLRSDGAPPLVHIRPQLTEDERREARLQAVALRPADAGPAIPTGTVFALATPPVRTRDDAVAQQVLLQSLRAQTATPVPTQLDVMAAQGRWRVVWWPHVQQQDAEALVLQARARGLKVELIAF